MGGGPTFHSPRSNASARSRYSAKSGASSRSRRSGMTQAELEEMLDMAVERSRRALQQALLLLQQSWVEVADSMPREETANFRKRLQRSAGLRGALRAAQAVSIESGTCALELALLWERCRTRGHLAIALETANIDELRIALKKAAALGLSVEVEKDLLEELEEATHGGISGRSTPILTETESPRNHITGDDAGIARVESMSHTVMPWWQRLAWWRQPGQPKKTWKGEESLLRAVREHVERGSNPLPQELAADLGLLLQTRTNRSDQGCRCKVTDLLWQPMLTLCCDFVDV